MVKTDENIKKKYNISDDDILNLYLYWKGEFIVALDDVKEEAQNKLLQELKEDFIEGNPPEEICMKFINKLKDKTLF